VSHNQQRAERVGRGCAIGNGGAVRTAVERLVFDVHPFHRSVRAVLAATVLAAALLSTGPAAAADPRPAPLAATAPSAAAAAIPPGEAGAKGVLETSPRHHEWADVALPEGAGKLSLFVAYPERKEKAPVVIVIHEIYGLTDWIRAVADRLAADGFIAIAPDMLTGRGPGGGGTEKFASRDDVVRAVRELAPAQVAAALDAAAGYGRSLPAASGKVATLGFCWGGAQSFTYATVRPALDAAVVYYGASPDAAALAQLCAPVLGLYGEDDARVNATVGPAEAKAKELGKTYLTATYPGAGHGFLRAQDGRDGANLAAALQAWPATVDFLRKRLEERPR
jgi:carboxymethylenebutenolidase